MSKPSKNPNKTQTIQSPENYQSPENETHLVHAFIEREQFIEGKKVSSGRVQKFTPQAYANFEKNAKSLGYSVDVLHQPTAAKGKKPTNGDAEEHEDE
jgi:hypothetical protein